MSQNEIISLNDSILGELSIEELENRLKKEKLDRRMEMWTCGCDCDEEGQAIRHPF